jgi:FkbM family methyltransferase
LSYAVLQVLGIEMLFRMRVGGTSIYIRSGTHDLAVARDSLGDELEVAIGLLPAGACGLIIDAGGYIGTSAIKLARAFPNARVVTVEPAPDNLKLLRRNVAHVPNITVVASALVGTPTDRVELLDPHLGEWGYSIVPRSSGTEVKTISVPTITIDALMTEAGADEIRILKLDIEGAEIDVLSNNIGWLQRTDLVIAELHDRLVEGCSLAFDKATVGRRRYDLEGEKVASLSAGLAAAAGFSGADLADRHQSGTR